MQLPLLSGLYRLVATALALDPSDLDPSDTTLLRTYLTDVAVTSSRLQGEELAAALQLQLAAPPSLLPREAALPALCAAFRAGLQHPPLAEAAVAALEAWERDGWGDGALRTQVKEQVAPLLAPLLGNIASWADATSSVVPTPELEGGGENTGEEDPGKSTVATQQEGDGTDVGQLSTRTQRSKQQKLLARQRAQRAEVRHVSLQRHGHSTHLCDDQ